MKNNWEDYKEYEEDMETLRKVEEALTHAKWEMAIALREGKLNEEEVWMLAEELRGNIYRDTLQHEQRMSNNEDEWWIEYEEEPKEERRR